MDITEPRHNLNREELLSLERLGDVSRFVDSATDWLSRTPDDDDLRLILVHRLSAFGLLHRARMTAAGFSKALQSSHDFRTLFSHLSASRQNGLDSWQRHDARFQSNLLELRRRWPWTDRLLSEWQSAHERFELHQTSAGSWQIFERTADDAGAWRPGFGDHRPRESADELARQVAQQVLTPIVIDGVGLGHHLSTIFDATRNTLHGASPILYQVETSWIALAAVLHLHDWREIIAHPRVRFCAGPDAHEQLRRQAIEDEWALNPKAVLRPVRWDESHAGRTDVILDELENRERSRCEALRLELKQRYAQRDAAWWSRRYRAAMAGEAPPLRILGTTCRFTTVLQYSMRDSLDALQALGCQSRLLIEPDDHHHVPTFKQLQAVREFDPDLILAIDHSRWRMKDGIPEGIPFVTWIQDRLPWLFDRKAGQAHGPLDFCIGYLRHELTRHYDYPARRFLTCYMATNPRALEGSDAPAGSAVRTGQSKYNCDVAFMTHASQTPEVFHAEYRGTCQNPLGLRLIDALHEELRSWQRTPDFNGGLLVEPFCRRVEQTAGIQVEDAVRRDLVANFVRPLLDRMIRHQTAAWVSDWAKATGRRFHLYGNGWERHPRFAEHARGVVGHGPELGEAFRRAKISLHASTNTAVHQRVLDGLAAGGFFLIRRHAWDHSTAALRILYNHMKLSGLRPPAKIRADDLSPSDAAAFLDYWRNVGQPAGTPWSLGESECEDLLAQFEQRTIHVADGLWPRLAEVTFHDEQSLIAQLERLLTDEPARRGLADEMRGRMLESFSHEALMRRVLHWLAECLQDARFTDQRRGAEQGRDRRETVGVQP